MKRIIRYILPIILLLGAACSKNDLSVAPPSSLIGDSFFRNSADAESALITAYNSVGNFNTNDYAKITEGPLNDIMIYNTQGLNLGTWAINENDVIIDQLWQGAYEGIFRANLVLQNVPDIDMDETRKSQILGEARFLRALFYWQLTTLFGDVPLITEADPTDASKAMLPKAPLADSYAVMVDDLLDAVNRLPKKSEYPTNDLGRATQGAAQALLGKVYLYASDYARAEDYLGQVISSAEYQLLPEFGDLLVVDNNAESIFEIQYYDVENFGSSRVANDYPQGQGGYANLLPTQDLVDVFESHSGPTAINGRDPRLFYSIFRDGDPYDNVSPVFVKAWTPSGYARKKGSYPVVRVNNYNLGRNFPIIRLADVLLMYAEAANENNRPDEAIAAINEVRGRASVGMPALPTAEFPVDNKQQIFDAIVHERHVELAFEHHWLHDLQRWNLASSVLSGTGYQSPKHRYLPIPQQELNNNPELDQNPEYLKPE